MYDHVVRAQRPSALEWLVVNALIPTVLMTFVLHAVRITRVAPLSQVDCYTGFLFPPDGFKPGGPVPDVFSVLIHMPEPAYPKSLRRAGIQDRYRFPSGGPMNALSSAVSITLHAAVGAALLLGTTKTVRSDPARPREVRVVLPREAAVNRGDGMGGPSLPGPIDVAPPDFNSVSGLATTPEGLMPQEGLSPVFSPTGGSESSATTGWSGVPTEEHAEVLTGPLPVYPDLLRQAGVQGRVVLEAVVDTTGRVLAPSILVVSRTNPGFVAPARQALLATLFRPAMVGGKPVRMRVRIPYEFAIRNGMGRAR